MVSKSKAKHKLAVRSYARKYLPEDHTGHWGLGTRDDDNDNEPVQQRPQQDPEPEPDTILPLYARAIEQMVIDMDGEDDQPELHFLDDDLDMSDWEDD
jgi:hypothetical protein